MKIDPRPYLEEAFGGDISGKTAVELASLSSWQFVRSNSQLATYELDLNAGATGHVMTAWEAYDAFGPHKLAEAMEYGSAPILSGKRSIENSLRSWRETLGMSPNHVVWNCGLSEDEIEKAENDASMLPIQTLERIAFSLGLDERKLAYDSTAGADLELARRLNQLASDTLVDGDSLPWRTISRLTEAASLIRVYSRLCKHLGLRSRTPGLPITLMPSTGLMHSTGRHTQPWLAGYSYAQRMRELLELGSSPLRSLSNVIEENLEIPVIRTKLQTGVAGATISVTDDDGQQFRGIVINVEGLNRDVEFQRVSLAHQLCHLLFDSDENLNKVRIDTYNTNQYPMELGTFGDALEQRAAAFAAELLAPLERVHRLAPPVVEEAGDPEEFRHRYVTGVADDFRSDPHDRSRLQLSISGDSVAEIVRSFGITQAAAQFQLANALQTRAELPSDEAIPDVSPSDLQHRFEEFSQVAFPIESTPVQRQGRFASLITAGYYRALLGEQTAAAYLNCEVGEFRRVAERIRQIYPLDNAPEQS